MSWRLLTKETESRHVLKSKKKLDDLDISLINELQIDSNQSPGLLARKFGVYNSTIHRRINRLIDENVIQFIAVTDPTVLGYEYNVEIGLKCAPDRIREVAEAVASYDNIQYVSICAGRYDIDTIGMFRKLNDLEEFISIELGKIAGLMFTETSVNHKAVKTLSQISVS